MINRLSLAVLIIYVSSLGPVSSAEFDSPEKLKKLFTTPTQRAELDKRRKAGVFDDDSSLVSQVLSQSSDVELKGIVYRKGEQPVVWVNDKNTLKSTRVDSNIRVYGVDRGKKTERAKLRVNDSFVKMKPGQVWSDFDNKARDKYQIKAAE